MFTGFPEETLRFFLDLRFHNSAAWFHENRERYEQFVRDPFYALIGDLVPALQAIDPQMEIRPHKVLSRINRDTRFSKDKSPYRDHLWLWFKRGGEERWMSLGYWFEFGPDRLSWGMASWGENRPLMDRFRRELAAHPRRYGGIIRSCGLPERHLVLDGSHFHRLEVPPGLPESLRPWYTLRDFAIMQTRPDPTLVSSRALLGSLVADYQAMGPIWQMLRGMQDALEQEEAAAGEVPDGDAHQETAGKKRVSRDEW